MILEKLKMNKVLIPILIIIFSLSMLFLGSGCNIEKAVEETIEEVVEEAPAEVAEEAPAEEEEEAEEVVEEDQYEVEYPVTIEDDAGQQEDSENRQITLEGPVEKIVVAEKCCATIIVELGLTDKVIGGPDWLVGYKLDMDGEATDEPNFPGYEDVPSIGGYSGIDVEFLISLGPDIFVNLVGHTDISDDQFEAAGIEIYTVGTIKDLDHIKQHITNYGIMFDEAEGAAKIVADMNSKEEKVKNAVDGLGLSEDEKPVVFMFGPVGDMETLQTWAPSGDTIVENLIVMAGGKCLTADQGLTGWPEYSIESLLDSDPDVIILPTGGWNFESVEQFTSLDLVQDLSAVINGNVYGIDSTLVFDLSFQNADALVLFAEFINGIDID